MKERKPSPIESRFQRSLFVMHETLGRCPRLLVNRAFSAKQKPGKKPDRPTGETPVLTLKNITM
jgi:hypothetical protein